MIFAHGRGFRVLFGQLAERLHINTGEFVGPDEPRAAARCDYRANLAHEFGDSVCKTRIGVLDVRNRTGVCLYVQPPFVDCMN